MKKFIGFILIILSINNVHAQYLGGFNDGAADGLLTQSNCGDITPNFIYFGGSNDGAADGLLSQSNCGDITPNFIYFGGSNDGAADGLLSQSVLTTATASISTPKLSICPNTSVLMFAQSILPSLLTV